MINTKEKIILSALTLFSENGIAKTSINEIAYHAGVTRVTVYRHFSDKEELVHKAFLQVEQVFQKGLEEFQNAPSTDWENVLKQIGDDLSALPSRDVFAHFAELKRLYPDVYNSIQKVREITLGGIFDHIFTITESQNLLRPDLNPTVVQAIFWELVINLFDNPRLKSSGLSNAALYNTMTDLLLHGILIN